MSVDPNKIVTFIITHKIQAGREAEYEVWIKDIGDACKQYEGHLGSNIIRPSKTHNTYAVIIRFNNYENLEKWVQSDTRKHYIDQIAPLLEKGDQYEIKTGIDFWFTPLEAKQKVPVRYKQYLVTLSAIYPLTLVVPFALSPILETVSIFCSILLSKLLVATVMVWLMTYVIMPPYTRSISKWLYK